MTRLRTLALGLVSLCVTSLLNAQTVAPAASVVTSWSPYLGCWSSSSAGVVGPMVCIVPTDHRDRVEIMSVVGDSVVSRTVVDATGTPRAQVRGDCVGFEEAEWSADVQRLYLHADYRCKGGSTQASDAIISMTASDAFSHVEGVRTAHGTRTSVVNFMQQRDTALYPDEVSRRLAGWLWEASAEPTVALVQPAPEDAVRDAAVHVDASVVLAWLGDRGDRTTLDEADLRRMRETTLAVTPAKPLVVPSARARSFLARGYRVVPGVLERVESSGSLSDRTNVMLTPDLVNFSGPGSIGYSRSVTFGWP